MNTFSIQLISHVQNVYPLLCMRNGLLAFKATVPGLGWNVSAERLQASGHGHAECA